MSKSIKLKSLLKEGFAWERKPGKPLPTIQEVMDEYEAKQKTEAIPPVPVKEESEYDESLLGPQIMNAAKEYARDMSNSPAEETSLTKAFIAGILWMNKNK